MGTSMHALTESLWEVISWRSKSRYDSASDQYTRIFMPKLFIISSLIMGFSYFNDKLNCMVHENLENSKEFVQEACWIQGFYIYDEMNDRLNESAFYGIPEHINYDGTTYRGVLCPVYDKMRRQPNCKPMTRRYFLQYQWIPFYVCSLSVLYFFPYLVFKYGNSDMISLVDTVRIGAIKDVDKIAHNYFNYKVNSKLKMKLILLFNLIVKLLFIFANVSGFALTDYIMDGRFLSYGLEWAKWNDVPNHHAHQINTMARAKPGDFFLPSVGICDIHEALHNMRSNYVDKHKVICEISQNIRYQYIFIILWFFFLCGVIISIIGFIQCLFTIAKSVYWIYSPTLSGKASLSDCIHSQLTIREIEYLCKVKSIDMTLYGELLRELTRFKPNIHAIKMLHSAKGEMITLLPTAPIGFEAV